jgi:GntR family transcriptional regulator/MocR family aminotransferase
VRAIFLLIFPHAVRRYCKKQRQPAPVGAFLPGVPDVSAFPHALFRKIQARISRKPQASQLSYSDAGGSQALQQALVEYLRVTRSVRCSAGQILITEGIHQAIDLVSRMLCNPAIAHGLKSQPTGAFVTFWR